jgi:hypothetical protein
MRVNEYAAELLVMFRTIGSSTKWEHVEKEAITLFWSIDPRQLS